MDANIPAAIHGRSVWKGEEMQKDRTWMTTFSEAGIAEVDSALRKIEVDSVELADINQSNFPLPHLEEELANAAKDVMDGRGFHVLRGLPVERYSIAQLQKIYLGIGSHFGTPVEQTREHEMLINVRDENGTSSKAQRGYHSVLTLPFHTDGACVVALLCINKAKEGGTTLLVSAGAIHNAIAEQDPRMLAPLYEGFPVHRRSCEPVGEPLISPWKLPVFSLTNGRLNCVYDYKACIWGEEAMRGSVTEIQKKALDAFDALTQCPDYQFSMELEPGDLQLVNNFTVLHSRTSFVSDPRPGKGRHLLRLWLDVPGNKHYAINKLHLYTRAALPPALTPTPSTAETTA